MRQPTDFELEAHDALKRRLKRAGMTFKEIANEIGCEPSLVTLVSQSRRRNPAVEKVLAQKLGLEPAELWPSRYCLQKTNM